MPGPIDTRAPGMIRSDCLRNLRQRRCGVAGDVIDVVGMHGQVERRQRARDEIVDIGVVDARVAPALDVQRPPRQRGIDPVLGHAVARQRRPVHPRCAQVDHLHAVHVAVAARQVFDGDLGGAVRHLRLLRMFLVDAIGGEFAVGLFGTHVEDASHVEQAHRLEHVERALDVHPHEWRRAPERGQHAHDRRAVHHRFRPVTAQGLGQAGGVGDIARLGDDSRRRRRVPDEEIEAAIERDCDVAARRETGARARCRGSRRRRSRRRASSSARSPGRCRAPRRPSPRRTGCCPPGSP